MVVHRMESPLRRWRERQGWSLTEVSGLTGLSRSYLSRVERGEREPAAATKVLVARRLGAPVADLFPAAVGEAPAA
jgi:transcriptional regulator with XRE-family HTH domain